MRRRQRRFRKRLLAASLFGALAIPLFVLLNCWTKHPGETVILLMPPVLGGILYSGWPAVRRIRRRILATYLAVLTVVISAAVYVAAAMASGRVLWMEVFWAVYFTVGWRIAWGLYKRTVGRLGERYRRWGRRTRRFGPNHHRGAARWAMAISPIRVALVALVFAPLFVGSMIHRIKIGNALEHSPYASLPLEDVTFDTADGLTLSGWFLAEPGSEVTVLICHGAGANKGNFIGFVELFHGYGFSTLIYDARGHGESDGHTSTFGLLETADVRAAVDWLKSGRPTYARHVFGLGSSMGAMTLVRAAADDPRIEAIVLDSCYLSAPRLARQHLQCLPYSGPWLGQLGLAAMSLYAGHSFGELEAGSALARFAPRPVFLIHGDEDVVIPPINLELLDACARAPKQKWLGHGPHSNILTTDFHAYRQRVFEFFHKAYREAPVAVRDAAPIRP